MEAKKWKPYIFSCFMNFIISAWFLCTKKVPPVSILGLPNRGTQCYNLRTVFWRVLRVSLVLGRAMWHSYYFFLTTSEWIFSMPFSITSVLDTFSTSEHSFNSWAVFSVIRNCKLTFFELSPLGGLPIFGDNFSPHFLPWHKYKLCHGKSQAFLSFFSKNVLLWKIILRKKTWFVSTDTPYLIIQHPCHPLLNTSLSFDYPFWAH